MKKSHLAGTLFILSGCTSVSASAINASDDLHCAVVIRTLEKNADQLGAAPAARRGLYVLQTWYFSRIKLDRLAQAQDVVEALKKDLSKVSSVGQECSKRAFSDAGFPRWKAIASDDYDRKAMR